MDRNKEVGGMRIGDVVRVAKVPTVVQLSALEDLKGRLDGEGEDLSRETMEELRFYVERYFLTERENRQAFETILASLGGRGEGGQGFWVHGVYGSGKSHLLAVLDLLAGYAPARRVFAASHPGYEEMLRGLEAGGGLRAVAVALDEHRPEEPLEDIVAKRFREEMRRQGPDAPLPTGRRERLAAMLERVGEAGCKGVVILLDELSDFLASRPKAGLHADATYLQFLGQRSRFFPLWVVATLSRPPGEWDLDPDLLAKVQDRFVGGLSLTIEHLPHLLSSKLLEHDEEKGPEALCRAWERAGGADGLLSRESLHRSYPFHPLTLEALTPLAARFFSQTRSAVDFAVCSAQESLERDAADLVGPDRIYDWLLARFADHPAFRPCRKAAQSLAADLPPGCPPDYGLSLVKALAAFSLTGRPLSVRQLVSCFPFPGLETSAGLLAAGVILERMRREGGSLEVERRERRPEDLWHLRTGWDERLFLKNRLKLLAHELAPDDERVAEGFRMNLPRDRFLLCAFTIPKTVEGEWLRSRRRCAVRWLDRAGLSLTALESCLIALDDPDQEIDAVLLIASPCAVEAQKAAFEERVKRLAPKESRTREGMLAWFPRPPGPDEAQVLIGYASLCMILSDPTLGERRLGREGMEFLKAEKSARDQDAALVLERLYGEGELCSPSGPLDLSPEGCGRDWEGFLRSLLEAVCARRYPQFSRFAPARRVISKGAAQEILARFIGPGQARPDPWSLLEVFLESVALPLSIASREESDRGPLFRLTAPAPDLWRNIESFLTGADMAGGGIGFQQAAGRLKKCAFGLTGEQADLVLESCLRLGLLVEERIGGTRLLRRGHRLSARRWPALARLAESLGLGPLTEDVPAQQKVWDALAGLREADPEAARQEMERVTGALGQKPDAWQEEETMLTTVSWVLKEIAPDRGAREGLEAFLESVGPDRFLLLGRLRELLSFLKESGPLEEVGKYLLEVGPELPEGDLARERMNLIEALADYRKVRESRTEILREFDAWKGSYIESYLDRHLRRAGPERANAYRELRSAPLWQVGARLGKLRIGKNLLERPERLLQETLGRQCPGLGLRELLAHRPFCPQCGLKPGVDPEWTAPEAILEAMREGVWDVIFALQSPGRLEFLKRASSRFPGSVREKLGALERMAPGRPAAEGSLPELFSDDLIEAIHRVLEGRISAHRPLSTLAGELSGREMTKSEALTALARWLDPEERLPSDAWIAFGG